MGQGTSGNAEAIDSVSAPGSPTTFAETNRDSPQMVNPVEIPGIGRALDAWSLLAYARTKFADRLAVVDYGSAPPSGGGARQLLTYEQLTNRCCQLAAALRQRGVGCGTRVAVLLRNCTEVMEVHYAAAALRAQIVNCNVNLAAPELRYILQHSEAEVGDEFVVFLGTVASTFLYQCGVKYGLMWACVIRLWSME